MRGFRKFSAHLTKCHACHGICTLSPRDAALPIGFAKNTQHDTSKVLRLPRKMTMDTSEVLRLPRKLQRIFWKRHKSIAPATQNDFRRVTKDVWMSRSATPATRNEATPRLKPPKVTPSGELTIGTAIWPSRGRLRTVADGCGRKRNVERTHPHPPEWNGNPCYAFGKKQVGLKYPIFWVMYLIIPNIQYIVRSMVFQGDENKSVASGCLVIACESPCAHPLLLSSFSSFSSFSSTAKLLHSALGCSQPWC